LLNWAVRYYPILRTLKRHGLLESGTLLEIGSGPYGIGTFRKVPFTGCDVLFPEEAVWPMTPMVASAADLPLADNSFDVVLASDVLEHIPPEIREKVISESLRVAKHLVIFGFPCGVEAHKVDEALRDDYLKVGREVPIWLEEHMHAPFPEPTLFKNLPPEWKVVQFGSENQKFHMWMVQQERSGKLVVRLYGELRERAPWMLEFLLRFVDSAPCYRQMFVMSRVDAA
jgi:hypothetical protein